MPDAPDPVCAPVFVLAAPRSLSSVTCAMLGQHPQLYGLPETHLFADDTVAQWWARCERESFGMAHGLLRAVAAICSGEQTEASVRAAAGWLRRRSGHTCGLLLEELAARVAPLTLVDKSPNAVYHPQTMARMLRYFPDARFIHLVRHPRAYCTSVLGYLSMLCPTPDGAAPQWIRDLASYPLPPSPGAPVAAPLPPLDPQGGWLALNGNAAAFTAALPATQATTVRAEDLLADPVAVLAGLVTWLGLRADEEALAPMLHPERSPFACFGPPSARLGNDILFLERPALRRDRARPATVSGPLEWRADGAGFVPEVVALATRLGYT